jgi:hypothetical protein
MCPQCFEHAVRDPLAAGSEPHQLDTTMHRLYQTHGFGWGRDRRTRGNAERRFRLRQSWKSLRARIVRARGKRGEAGGSASRTPRFTLERRGDQEGPELKNARPSTETWQAQSGVGSLASYASSISALAPSPREPARHSRRGLSVDPATPSIAGGGSGDRAATDRYRIEKPTPAYLLSLAGSRSDSGTRRGSSDRWTAQGNADRDWCRTPSRSWKRKQA